MLNWRLLQRRCHPTPVRHTAWLVRNLSAIESGAMEPFVVSVAIYSAVFVACYAAHLIADRHVPQEYKIYAIEVISTFQARYCSRKLYFANSR